MCFNTINVDRLEQDPSCHQERSFVRQLITGLREGFDARIQQLSVQSYISGKKQKQKKKKIPCSGSTCGEAANDSANHSSTLHQLDGHMQRLWSAALAPGTVNLYQSAYSLFKQFLELHVYILFGLVVPPPHPS